MDNVNIIRVEVSEQNNLLVTPAIDEKSGPDLYQYIYRMATGVFWNEGKQSFSSPVPREWSYFQWFENIVYCAESELGLRLLVTPNTQWINVPNDEKKEMVAHASSNT